MNKFFSIEKIWIHTENMDFTKTKIRVKLFGHTIISYVSFLNYVEKQTL